MAMTTSKDKTMRVWNLVTGRQSYIVNCKEDVPIVQWSPSGHLYALVVKNKAFFYELKTASFVHKVDFQSRITSLQFISENIVAITGDNSILKLYEISSESCSSESAKLSSRIKAMKVCSTSNPTMPNVVVAALSDGWIKIWKYESNAITEVVNENIGLRLTSICCLLSDH
ncbi:uncharacterized protein TRIADDRAFT_58111 [Trichoplax adhaerens]|uniref:Uncharacterized protein n=1 Tax=Trichoplax adhaerens TaxID=10228 RepID=B3S2Q6_TRIAD|nr:hypothetical protein TRIADDRAFT_58111 [Trichoplax adhaerens]EDV23462.1 hypothetical protein TRIADDRAFT_58111 [Trichoplax adhaerens]|eukprot:XP_002114372.1 hypothetical protein TRIADDRAFT_58111 [Trichoplax adhaerens]